MKSKPIKHNELGIDEYSVFSCEDAPTLLYWLSVVTIDIANMDWQCENLQSRDDYEERMDVRIRSKRILYQALKDSIENRLRSIEHGDIDFYTRFFSVCKGRLDEEFMAELIEEAATQ